MSDLMQGTSGYAVGVIDTTSVLLNGVSSRAAEHINGPAAAIIQIEQALGSALTLKGTKADLSTRLAVALNSDGKINASATSAFAGQLTVANGGTGTSTLASGRVLLGSDANAVVLGSGLIYQGPTSVGVNSAISQEGTVTISSNQALSGLHFYDNFTLDAGKTLTVADGAHRLIIFATTSITLNGTIDAVGAGSVGASPTGTVGIAGGNGATQVGGAGGGVPGQAGGKGGDVYAGSVLLQAGPAQGVTATQITGNLIPVLHPFGIYGGAGGGSGAGTASNGGVGGRGGGSIILVAPSITLGLTCTLNTSGDNATTGGTGTGGGGGGGAGQIYIFTRSFIDSGATFTMNGGSGANGNGGAGGAQGTNGATGLRQILIYA